MAGLRRDPFASPPLPEGPTDISPPPPSAPRARAPAPRAKALAHPAVSAGVAPTSEPTQDPDADVLSEGASDGSGDALAEWRSLPAVLTADELAAFLRLDRKTVYAAFRAGELPGGRRIGGTIRFSRDAVLRWLEEGRAPRGATLAGGQAGVSRARKGDAR